MAIIELGEGSFIAGEPDTELHSGNHWCEYCRGDGLEDYDGELIICGACCGVGQIACDDRDCDEHGSPWDHDHS